MGFEDLSCAAKRGYASKQEAKLGISFLVKNHGEHRSKLCVYECVYCRQWHVGHKRRDLLTIANDLKITAEGHILPGKNKPGHLIVGGQ